MTVLYLLLGFFLISGEFARTIFNEMANEADEAAARAIPTPVGRHRVAEVATVLPKRPAGRAALKAEIQHAENVDIQLVPARFETPAPVHFHPTHPEWQDSDDWRFNSGEWQMAWEDFFGQEPDNLAVSREWAGVGTVAG